MGILLILFIVILRTAYLLNKYEGYLSDRELQKKYENHKELMRQARDAADVAAWHEKNNKSK
jgi:hypothetical protein